MKRIASLLGCLLLGACASTDLITQQHIVVKPSAAMYKCDTADLPNPDTLTDIQVARLIETLYANNVQCKASLDSIRKFLNVADAATKPTPTQARNWLKKG